MEDEIVGLERFWIDGYPTQIMPSYSNLLNSNVNYSKLNLFYRLNRLRSRLGT